MGQEVYTTMSMSGNKKNIYRKHGKEKLKNVSLLEILKVLEDYQTSKRALGRFKWGEEAGVTASIQDLLECFGNNV